METALVAQQPREFSLADIQLIKETVCKGGTDQDFKLFLYNCQRTGLDPLAKQVYAVMRWDSRLNRQAMTIQTGIDGYRVIAQRSGQLAGEDDVIYDTQTEPHPNVAKVTVYRLVQGQRVGFTASARWTEYVQTKDGNPIGLWGKMPYLMLGKCAAALAYRKAFPNDLSGIYTHEEMQQADKEVPAVVDTTTGEVTESPKPEKKKAKLPPTSDAKINQLRTRCRAGEAKLKEHMAEAQVRELAEAYKCTDLDTATETDMLNYLENGLLKAYKEVAA